MKRFQKSRLKERGLQSAESEGVGAGEEERQAVG